MLDEQRFHIRRVRTIVWRELREVPVSFESHHFQGTQVVKGSRGDVDYLVVTYIKCSYFMQAEKAVGFNSSDQIVSEIEIAD